LFDDIGPGDGDVDENEEAEEFEPDTATIAFLDQQQAEFVNMEQEFEETYGFSHNCHCGEDYAAGRVGEITQCYHNMMQEALATCARLNAELKEMTGIAQALFQELQGRIKAEEGAGSVPDESAALADSGAERDSESEPEPASVGSEASELGTVDDSAGEGFGVQGEVLGTKTDPDPDPGSPDERKLI
jgi:hypothetical protein